MRSQLRSVVKWQGGGQGHRGQRTTVRAMWKQEPRVCGVGFAQEGTMLRTVGTFTEQPVSCRCDKEPSRDEYLCSTHTLLCPWSHLTLRMPLWGRLKHEQLLLPDKQGTWVTQTDEVVGVCVQRTFAVEPGLECRFSTRFCSVLILDHGDGPWGSNSKRWDNFVLKKKRK